MAFSRCNPSPCLAGLGIRAGLRGGSLTALAVPPWRGALPLWRLLWANVPTGQRPSPNQLPSIFPWLTATRTARPDALPRPPIRTIFAPTGAQRGASGLNFRQTPRRRHVTYLRRRTASLCIVGASGSMAPTTPPGSIRCRRECSRQKPTDAEWLPIRHAQPGDDLAMSALGKGCCSTM